MPSFLPDIDSSIKAIMASVTPIHWYRLSTSPYIIMAPMSVSIGCEALIGAAIVMGKCLVAKYAKSHEDSTMQALMKMNRCVRKLAAGT